jgi:hypothetical protein
MAHFTSDMSTRRNIPRITLTSGHHWKGNQD